MMSRDKIGFTARRSIGNYQTNEKEVVSYEGLSIASISQLYIITE